MSTYQIDVTQSRNKENEFANILTSKGWVTTTTQASEYFPAYDLAASSGTTTNYYEVKYDRKSTTTGNVAVELYKVINDVKMCSGLTATKSTYYIFCFTDDSNFYQIKTHELFQLIKMMKYKFNCSGGDNNSSQLAIFDKEFLLSHCEIIYE